MSSSCMDQRLLSSPLEEEDQDPLINFKVGRFTVNPQDTVRQGDIMEDGREGERE